MLRQGKIREKNYQRSQGTVTDNKFGTEMDAVSRIFVTEGNNVDL